MTDDFRELPDFKLDRLGDQQLLAYVAAAQAVGHARAVEHALWRLIDRHARWVRAKVALKIPNLRSEEIAQDVLLHAVKAVLAGRKIDDFKAWINRVAANKIADFWRSQEGQQLQRDRAGGGAGDEDDRTTADESLSDLQDLIESLLSELSDAHRRVIELYVFEDAPAREVAAETGESVDNVYQVAKRFRHELRRRLESPDMDTEA